MWRPQHLKDCLTGPHGQINSPFLLALTRLTNLVLHGTIPSEVRPLIYGANLIALNKKDGGIRPIAVGEVFRRIAAKCALAVTEKQVAQLTAPLQLGCGVRRGIDAGVHAARTAVMSAEQGEVMLKIDFENAFNSLRRDHVYETVAKYIPSVSQFVLACYENDSLLSFGDYTLPSSEGLQQGDPIAPMLFCLALHDVIAPLSARIKIAYLDDVTLIGEAGIVADDFAKLKSVAAKLGLTCNVSKCEIVPLHQEAVLQCDLQSLFPGIPVVHVTAAKLLGAALGTASLHDVLVKHHLQINTFKSQLSNLKAHDAFYLLKNCLSLPKLLFTLRTSPCFSCPDLLNTLDLDLQDALELILNIRCNDTEWQQARLPTKLGGLGVPSTKMIASAAFLASYKGSQTLIQVIAKSVIQPTCVFTAENEWKEAAGCPYPTSPFQAAWSRPVYRRQLCSILEGAPPHHKARIYGCCAPGASAWLEALPSGKLGLRLTDEQLRIAACLRLGAPVVASSHLCVCGSTADTLGMHALSCPHMKARHSRHGQLNEIISLALTSAHIPNRREPSGLSRTDGRRPDGLSLTPWSRGRCLLWDATCVHRLARSWVAMSASSGTPAADASEQKKRDKYLDLCNEYEFHPIAFETLGGVGSSTRSFLCSLGRRIAITTGEEKASRYLLQRLAVATQRGNAACILECALPQSVTFSSA